MDPRYTTPKRPTRKPSYNSFEGSGGSQRRVIRKTGPTHTPSPHDSSGLKGPFPTPKSAARLGLASPFPKPKSVGFGLAANDQGAGASSSQVLETPPRLVQRRENENYSAKNNQKRKFNEKDMDSLNTPTKIRVHMNTPGAPKKKPKRHASEMTPLRSSSTISTSSSKRADSKKKPKASTSPKLTQPESSILVSPSVCALVV